MFFHLYNQHIYIYIYFYTSLATFLRTSCDPEKILFLFSVCERWNLGFNWHISYVKGVFLCLHPCFSREFGYFATFVIISTRKVTLLKVFRVAFCEMNALFMIRFAIFCLESHKITAYGYLRVPCLPPQTKEGQLSFKVQQIAQVWEYGSRAGCLSNSQLILAVTDKSCLYFVELKTKNCSCCSITPCVASSFNQRNSCGLGNFTTCFKSDMLRVLHPEVLLFLTWFREKDSLWKPNNR